MKQFHKLSMNVASWLRKSRNYQCNAENKYMNHDNGNKNKRINQYRIKKIFYEIKSKFYWYRMVKKLKRTQNEMWTKVEGRRQFFRDTDETVDKKKSWLWLKSTDLKKETEALLMTAKEQAIFTNYIKYHIDKSRDLPTCRMCDDKRETESHIVYECSIKIEA